MRSRTAEIALCLLRLLTLVTLVLAGSANGQAQEDDWALTRERTVAAPRKAPRRDPASELDRLYRALLASPGSDDALERLRTAELSLHGELTPLLEQLRAARDHKPRAAAPRQALARVLFSLGQSEEALTELERAAREADDGQSSLSLRARLLRELGRHEEAAAQLHAASTRARGRSAASLLRDAAREELSAGLPERALETLDAARALGGAGFAVELRELSREALRGAGRLPQLAEQLEGERDFAAAAELWSEQGDVSRALLSLQKAVQLAPNDRAARALLARGLADAGRLEAARHEASELLRRSADEPATVVVWAELVRDTGGAAEALTRLRRMSAQKPRDAGLHRALRALYLRWSEPALAEHELTLLRTLEPTEPSHRLALADQALLRGERALAVRLLEQTRGTGAADDAELARTLGERDLLPEAVARAERAVSRAPSVLPYRRQLASLLERAGRSVDAEHVLMELATREESQRATREARAQLVALWRRAGSERLHTAELESRLRADPHDVAALRLLLGLHADVPGQLARRRVWIDQLLALRADDVEALLWLERAQLEARDVPAALQTQRRLLSTAEGVEHASAALALSRRYPREPEVPALMGQALLLSPRASELQRLAGEVWVQRGELTAAKTAYERAVELDGGDFAARLELAQLALAAGDTSAAEAQLVIVVRGASDELLDGAARMLWRLNPARAEAVLARSESTMGDADGRLDILLSQLAVTLLPGARRLLAGEATAAEQAQLEQAVPRLLGALLRSLSLAVAAARLTALTLLAAVPAPAAESVLWALAERSDAPPLERSLALTALGRAAASEEMNAAARLRALYLQAPRSLRPVILWAQTGSPDAASMLSAAQNDRDPALRDLATLLLRAPSAPGPDALFATLPARRELGALWLTHPPARTSVQPVPGWPFELETYRLALERAALDTSAHAVVQPGAWAALLARVQVRLADPTLVSSTLAQLVPYAGGLVPGALLTTGACVDTASARQLAEALERPLLALLESSDVSLRLSAQALLLASGSAGQPELLRRLDGADSLERRALLRRLSTVHPLPERLVPRLRELRASASDWPTRLWAARALQHAPSLDAAPLAHEPVALVRLAGGLRTSPQPPATTCSSPDPVAN